MDISKYEPEIQKAIKNFEETVKSIKNHEVLKKNAMQLELMELLKEIEHLKTIIANEER